MNIKKTVLSVILLSSIGTSGAVWPSFSLPKISLEEIVPLALIGGAIGITYHNFFQQKSEEKEAKASLSYQRKTLHSMFSGFARFPNDMSSLFKKDASTKKIGELECNPLFQNNFRINEDKNATIIQVETEKQTINTCLYHALKNAVLLYSQIIKKSFPLNNWTILNDMTLLSENEWHEPYQLDEFLQQNQRHTDDENSSLIEFDVTAISKDKIMLLSDDLAADLHDNPLAINCVEKITRCLQEASPKEPYCHAFIILNTNAAVTEAASYHWYCLFIHQDGYGNRNYIIADSLNVDRTKEFLIIDIITEIEQQFS
ncbi:hypothetical protein K9K77_01430 [Candidatus Babeliales bacterium]|nr:hypothetical protein [Candidatus Babeliales bacterium]